MKLDIRQRLLTTTLLVSAGLIANPAYAQDTTQSTVPDQNQATNPGAAPPTGPVEASPTPTISAQGEPVQQPQDIVITGTRIPQPNLQSAAPVAVVSNQDIKLSGTTRIEDALAQLPSAAAPQASGISNAATGTAEVDLRYMGSKRTLALVNGRRLTPGDPAGASQAADINIIPASLLKRVEVLTGGASSVYGADAVAGVVNFIMDTDFSGLRLDGQWSVYQHNNRDAHVAGGTIDQLLDANGFPYPKGSVTGGRGIDGTVSFGAGFDDGRGHVIGYFGYRKINSIIATDRDYSACTLGGSGASTCSGSYTTPEGNAFFFTKTGPSTIGLLGPGTFTTGAYTTYNYGALNYYQRPDERYTAGLFANYEINPAINPYLEFMFMDDHTLAQIAPSGDFFSTYSINCDNPLMSTQQRNTICTDPNMIVGIAGGSFPVASGAPYAPGLGFANGSPPLDFYDAAGNVYNNAFFQLGRRNVEGGPRIADLTHTSYRGVLGTRGDLSNVFSYDAYYQYGRTDYNQVYRNEFSSARLRRALNVVNVDPTTGQEVAVGTPGSVTECRSVLDQSDPGCVPYDIFTGAGPSAAAINYLNVYGVMTGRTSEQIADVNFTGNLGEMGWRSPWASDGIGVNAGWEYRKESLTLSPDQEFQTGDLAGQGGPTLPVDGNFHVNELFGEIRVPIVQHSVFDELTVSAGYRKSWYGLSNGRKFNTDTYKIEGQFAPIADVRLRASYNRAVRAPNIQELFAPIFVALDGGTDPCSAHVIQATEYGCIAQGMTVGGSTPKNPAEQYNGQLGGNENLLPEVATTKTVGVVLQPRFLPRFSLSVDYWNIDLKGAIQGFGADTILADCVANTTATTVAPSCGLIHRDPGGSIWLTPQGYVVDTPTNVGGIKTDGIDVNAAFAHRLGGLGQLSMGFNGTWVNKFITDNGIAPPYDCVGYYGTVCSAANTDTVPEWRHKLRGTLQMPFGLGVSLQWRHVSHLDYEGFSNDVALNRSTNELGAHVKAQDYFDVAATYTLWDMVNLRAGVNNVLDRIPPLIPNSRGACPTGPCNNNSYPGVWDTLGRYIYAGATIDFTHKPTIVAPPPVVAPPPPPPAPPATITCPDGLVILANETCPAPPPPPPPPPPAPERG